MALILYCTDCTLCACTVYCNDVVKMRISKSCFILLRYSLLRTSHYGSVFGPVCVAWVKPEVY